MLLQLIRFEALFQSKQRALPIFILIFAALGFFHGIIGQAPAQVDYNSAYQISNNTTLSTLGCVFIIMFFAISGVIRDKKYLMESLIYSTSLQKNHFFWSRFIGVFIFSVLAFSLFLPGFVLGLSLSDLDPDRIASFQLSSYLWPFLVIIVPNIFICTSFIFSVSILSKSNLATYASAVLIYILYFITAFYSNSPIMASSIPASPEQMAIAAIIDPFAAATFFEHTQFWTPFDKSNLMLSFSGTYLWNRLLWIGVSLLILGITYRLFSFRKSSQKIKKKQKTLSRQTTIKPYIPVIGETSHASQWIAFWSSLQIDIKGIFKSLPFLVVILTLFGTSMLEVYSRIFDGGSYGDSWYPFTNLLIEIVMELVPMLSLILIVFYGGELLWKARDQKFDSILHTSPTLNWVFFLSKFTALTLVPVLLISTAVIVCIIFQLLNGYTNLEIEQYLAVFYYHGATLFVSAMISIFIQSIVKNKYLGMGITGFVLLFLGTSLSANLGIEHPMLRIGYMPIPVYSNMSGYSLQASAFHMFAIYWIALGVILSILSFKFWKRGVISGDRFRESVYIKKWKRWEIASFGLACTTFLIAAVIIFKELHINHTYRNSNDRMDYAEQYERTFKKYDTIPRLHYIDIKTEVDIYPSSEKYSIDADYKLINKNGTPVTHIFLTERVSLSKIQVDQAKLVFKDTVYGTYLFKFDSPILPQETARLRYNFTKKSSPYRVDRMIANNGSYIRHDQFEPALGYRSSIELSDRQERIRRGLPEQEIEFEVDTHLYGNKVGYGDVNYETIISTDADQIAIAPGNLEKKWTSEGRNFFHYKFPEKHIPALAYFSADYELKKHIYNDISLEYYYHPSHEINHTTIHSSTEKTLEYCIENFGGYPFDHLRIAEVPSYHSYGGVAHPGLINMVEDNLYLIDIRNTGTFDLVSKRTIHEVAHQWWGMILTPKNVAGGGFIVEGFAKYTEGVVLEEMYGKGALWELNKASNDRYFKGRAFASTKEPPIYLEDGQNYLAYGKSSLVMLSIRDLIGEEKLNKVLYTLTQKHRQQHEYHVHTLEFLDELYKVTPQEYHPLIDEWMKEIVRYDVSIGTSSYKQLDNGKYEITLEVNAKRFITLEDGSEKEIAIQEPIQIGLFKTHPKDLGKDETPIYLKPHLIKSPSTQLKIQVDTLPNTIAIDPFLTRVDRIYSDNMKELE